MRAVQEVLDHMDIANIDGGHPECPQIHIPPAHTHALTSSGSSLSEAPTDFPSVHSAEALVPHVMMLSWRGAPAVGGDFPSPPKLKSLGNMLAHIMERDVAELVPCEPPDEEETTPPPRKRHKKQTKRAESEREAEELFGNDKDDAHALNAPKPSTSPRQQTGSSHTDADLLNIAKSVPPIPSGKIAQKQGLIKALGSKYKPKSKAKAKAKGKAKAKAKSTPRPKPEARANANAKAEAAPVPDPHGFELPDEEQIPTDQLWARKDGAWVHIKDTIHR